MKLTKELLGDNGLRITNDDANERVDIYRDGGMTKMLISTDNGNEIHEFELTNSVRPYFGYHATVAISDEMINYLDRLLYNDCMCTIERIYPETENEELTGFQFVFDDESLLTILINNSRYGLFLSPELGDTVEVEIIDYGNLEHGKRFIEMYIPKVIF